MRVDIEIIEQRHSCVISSAQYIFLFVVSIAGDVL